MDRPTWTEYFLSIADVVSTRSDCIRRKVGAVIVKDNRIVATGYNGAPSGRSGCLDLPCPRAYSDVSPGSSYDTGEGSCIAIHAEANALLYADYSRCVGSTAYVSAMPCDGCRKLMAGAGIHTVIARNGDFVDGENLCLRP